jgi:hypothetical protein
MAKPVHASGDIWYRSVEDLLSALDTGKATSASTALAINLQTSAVPLDLGLKASLQFEGLHVYRLLHRLDNGLPQFQLRLGIIESDLQADAILAVVREHYPGATKRPVGEADRTAIARLVGAAQNGATRRSAAPRRHQAGSRYSITDLVPAVPPEDTAGTSKPKRASITEDLQWNIDEVLRHLTHRPAQIEETLAREAPAVEAPAVEAQAREQTCDEPSPDLGTTSPASETSGQGTTADSGELQSIVDRIGALTSAAEEHRATRALPEFPAIDSTQTVRALTPFELHDDDAETSRWFVLQLMQSQEPIDPEQVPNLDIFSEYRLYAVGEADRGAPLYALRLGFFSSEVAAGAVAGYLAPHFPTTDIKRVSLAEHDRFAQNVVVARKDVGLAGSHAVIEFSSPRALPAASPQNGVASAGPKDPPQAPESLWSRLIPRRVPRQ